MQPFRLFSRNSQGLFGLNNIFLRPSGQAPNRFTFPLSKPKRECLKYICGLTDLPAHGIYRYENTTKHRYLNSAADEPAISVPGVDVWMDFGYIHRQNPEQPAIVTYNSNRDSDKVPDWVPVLLTGAMHPYGAIESLHWYSHGLLENSQQVGAAIYSKTAKHRYTQGVWQDDTKTCRPASEYTLEAFAEILQFTSRYEMHRLVYPVFVRAVDGVPHCIEDKPAFQWADGTVAYLRNGLLDRDNGQPAVIYSNGQIEYYTRGVFVGRE